jgi:hypothetical protein
MVEPKKDRALGSDIFGLCVLDGLNCGVAGFFDDLMV